MTGTRRRCGRRRDAGPAGAVRAGRRARSMAPGRTDDAGPNRWRGAEPMMPGRTDDVGGVTWDMPYRCWQVVVWLLLWLGRSSGARTCARRCGRPGARSRGCSRSVSRQIQMTCRTAIDGGTENMAAPATERRARRSAQPERRPKESPAERHDRMMQEIDRMLAAIESALTDCGNEAGALSSAS